MYKISDVFYENIYNIFVEYCKKEGLSDMSDLENFDFDKLSDVKGIGVSKIKNIKSKYKKFLGNELAENVFLRVHKDNYSLSVDSLSLFKISKSIISLLKKNNINTINDLVLYGNSNLYKINTNIYKKITAALDSYITPLFDSVDRLLDKFKGEENYDVILKRARGETLNNIGKELNVTRERVRQIEVVKLKKLLIILDIVLIHIAKENNYKYCVNLNKLDEMFEGDNHTLLRYTLSVSYRDYYLDFCNKLLINGETKNTVMDKLGGITEYYIKDIVNFASKMVVITESLAKNGIPYIDIEDLTNYLLLNGYIKKGNYIFRSGISYGLICELIIKNHFKKGIRIHDEEDLNKLRAIVEDEFEGLILPENNRALGTRISYFLVLCDRGCYTVASNINIASFLLREIYDYIGKYKESTLFFNDIFVHFKDKLLKYSNVHNRYFLQGVLKYYYEDDFEFERDSLTKKGFERKNIRELISDFIKEKKRPVHRKEIKDSFPGATDVVITNSQISNKDILQWEYNYYMHTDNLFVSEENKRTIEKHLCDIFDIFQGYCSEQLLYESLIKVIPEFFIKNNIKNASNLFYLASYLFKMKYTFRRPHIIRGSYVDKELSSRKVIERFLFKDGFLKYSEYQKFVTTVKWSIGTAYAVFKDIEKDIVRISEDEYVVRDKFNISKEDKAQIFDLLRKLIKKNEFLSLCKFADFDKLPDIGYLWNPFILSSVVTLWLPNDIRMIVPQVEDRRYVKEILVFDDFFIENYEQLIIYVIKKNNLSGSTLYHLEYSLSSLGLIGRYLPKELYNSKNIYIENDRFYAV